MEKQGSGGLQSWWSAADPVFGLCNPQDTHAAVACASCSNVLSYRHTAIHTPITKTMKRSLSLLLLFALLSVLFLLHMQGQETESEHHKAVVDQLEKNYNANDYGAVFSAFSGAMQEALPMQETEKFFTGVKTTYGKIVEREFIQREQLTARYKMRGERGTFVLIITVSAENKILGLFIKPFAENELPKMERTKTGLILPFNEEWTLFWGGDTPEQNYHVAGHGSQKHAFDFVIRDERGKSYLGIRTNQR